MNIILTGFMGTGKTEAGKKVASILKMNYIDTDEVIEKDVQKSIPRIFKDSGEKYFREVESRAVKCVALLDGFVISTGGGVVLNSDNMDELEKNGVVICLTASPGIILKRTRHTNYRPLLNVENPEEKITNLIEKRKLHYSRCSLTVDTSEKSIKEVVGEIINYIENRQEEHV